MNLNIVSENVCVVLNLITISGDVLILKGLYENRTVVIKAGFGEDSIRSKEVEIHKKLHALQISAKSPTYVCPFIQELPPSFCFPTSILETPLQQWKIEKAEKSFLERLMKSEKGFIYPRQGYIMDYYPSDLFSTFVESGQNLNFTDTQFFAFAFKICTIVKWLHQNRVVHYDLKLDNLLVSDDGELVLCDFGFSEDTQFLIKLPDKKSPLYFKGSSYYRAPELFKDPFGNPFQCDIWSLGVLLFTGYFKYPPFTKPDPRACFYYKEMKQCIADPNQIDQCHLFKWKIGGFSRKVVEFLLKFLNPDPVKRITVDEIFLLPEMQDIQQSPNSLASISEFIKSGLKFDREATKTV